MGFLLSFALIAAAAGGGSAPTSRSLLADYVRVILESDNGYVDVAALDLPPEFVQRVADRSVRVHFRRQYRRVVPDPQRGSCGTGFQPVKRQAGSLSHTVAGGAPMPSILRATIPTPVVEGWRRFREAIPELRGFRAPVLSLDLGDIPSTDRDERASGDSRTSGSQGADATTYREAATFVAQNLARDGLVRTTMRTMRRHPLAWVRGGVLNESTLRAVGIPADLLSYFTLDETPLSRAATATRVLADWVSAGGARDAVDRIASRAKFTFEPSCPGFVVMSEDGSEPVGAIRIQLATSRYAYGVGDGSQLDVFRQVAMRGRRERHPQGVTLQAFIAEEHLADLLREISAWQYPSTGRITLVPTALPVSRWAQDNGKAGLAARVREGTHAPADDDRLESRSHKRRRSHRRRVVTLIPRFASMNEQAAKFVPGDSFVFKSLAALGADVVQSPLLFQGGDLLPFVDPATGARVLLMGEADVYRNRALGLTSEQVLTAFRLEFGVDRCVVLPAVSYHIDLEVTVRRRPGAPGVEVACVNDAVAASRIIARAGVGAFVRGGVIPVEHQEALVEALERGEVDPFVSMVWSIVTPFYDRRVGFSEDFARLFARSGLESGSGNARRFLLALDILTASALTDEEAADESRPIDLQRYLQALRRREADRRALARKLADLGLRVHRVPSLSDEDASINYLNGVHTSSTYMMPVFGGFYETLDDAAGRAMTEAFGPAVRVDPIRSAHVQARYGGLHCMVAVSPRAARDGRCSAAPRGRRKRHAQGTAKTSPTRGDATLSLLGRPLKRIPPGARRTKLEADLTAARAGLAASPDDPARTVWVGRRLGYLWRMNEAIEVYSRGIEAHPDYAPLYRHRGHRYISIRRFDKAIADLERAARLLVGKSDEIEPDGMPNARNIPLTTTGFNVWYHLGLARYFKGDYKGALAAFRETLAFTRGYDDNLVATTDWMYMTLRRLGRPQEAAELLEAITPELDIIENMAYHRRLLMYKGIYQPSDLLGADAATDLDLATLGYGVGQWYLAQGEAERAAKVFERIVAGPYWPAFGFIAAEVDLSE